MARNYANLFTAIWARDGEFVRLSCGAQRMYLLLVSQPEVSACGMLPLRLRRWSALAPDTTEGDLRMALKELEEHRFVVVDEDTEELLVRSFTRHDNGYANPRRQPSIRDAANGIESPSVLAVLAEEFEKLGLPDQWRGRASSTEWLSDRQSIGGSGTPRMPTEGGSATPLTRRISTDSTPTVDKRHDHAYALGNGYANAIPGIDGMANRFQTARTTTHNPQPVPNGTGGRVAAPTPAKRGSRIPDGFVVTEAMRAWAGTECPAANVDFETAKFRDHWLAASGANALKRDWVAAWRNWMRKATPSGPGPNRPTNGWRPYMNPDNPDTAYNGYKLDRSPGDAA